MASTDLLSVSEVAKDFLSKSGYMFARLEKSAFDAEHDAWRLTFDVGITLQKFKTVSVDAKSMRVVAFE